MRMWFSIAAALAIGLLASADSLASDNNSAASPPRLTLAANTDTYHVCISSIDAIRDCSVAPSGTLCPAGHVSVGGSYATIAAACYGATHGSWGPHCINSHVAGC